MPRCARPPDESVHYRNKHRLTSSQTNYPNSKQFDFTLSIAGRLRCDDAIEFAHGHEAEVGTDDPPTS